MKYQGNKRRIIGDILPIILSKLKNKSAFVDAFCGSCSVIQEVPIEYKRIANDKNKYLIAMLSALNDSSISFPYIIPKDFYDKVRDCAYGRNNDYTDAMTGWVGYMASYNGRFFDGGYSGHHVIGKNGKSRDYISENINNTLKQKDLLKGIEWHSGDYSDIPIPDNSLIYCDPPYRGTKQYFTSKNFDYEKFYKWCREMKKKGHTILVSEYDMPNDFRCIWSKQITNAMNQTITKKPVEKLFTL